MPGGLEPPHPFLPLSRWLVGVLGAVVQVSVLSVSNARHHDSFSRGVAAQVVSNDYSRMIKEKIQLRRFHVQGLIKAGIEALWAYLTFNIQRALTLQQRLIITPNS